MARLVVLDAGVVIALYNDLDPHHDWARGVFVQTIADRLVMPSLTYAEILVHPSRAGRREQCVQAIAGLSMTVEPVTAERAGRIAHARATTSLKMPDAVVLALATEFSGVLATTDDTLRRVARDQGLEVII